MDGTLEKIEVMCVPESAVKRWEGLMQKKSVDYGLENLPRFSCVFSQTVKFNDGILVDLKVCTSDHNCDVWSEAVVYDEHGHEVWVSPVSDRLLGTWEFELKNIYVSRPIKYKLVVIAAGEPDETYNKLGCTRDDFCKMVQHEIEEGITSEYSAKIADTIADKVAVDVLEAADPEEWNSCDVRLGIGRVILRRFGVEV